MNYGKDGRGRYNPPRALVAARRRKGRAGQSWAAVR